MSDFDRLVLLLNQVRDALPKLEDSQKFLHDDDHANIAEIRQLASEVLITPQGQTRFDLGMRLEDDGHYVFCVERDQFGWLQGGIHLSVGIITYG